ncbi:MAG: deaminase [Bacilli bacterium]|nr:deaminase [Bacilli bacterium]
MNILKFIPIANAIAELSKDPSTKIGCLIIDDDGNILTTGYNGFPRGVADSERRLDNRELKYQYVSHAEANAIAQAARVGARLLGSNLIVTSLYPCSSCAKLIIQAGIKCVYVPKSNGRDAQTRWKKETDITNIMFKEAKIKIIEY